jgi:hypothetical protein
MAFGFGGGLEDCATKEMERETSLINSEKRMHFIFVLLRSPAQA